MGHPRIVAGAPMDKLRAHVAIAATTDLVQCIADPRFVSAARRIGNGLNTPKYHREGYRQARDFGLRRSENPSVLATSVCKVTRSQTLDAAQSLVDRIQINRIHHSDGVSRSAFQSSLGRLFLSSSHHHRQAKRNSGHRFACSSQCERPGLFVRSNLVLRWSPSRASPATGEVWDEGANRALLEPQNEYFGRIPQLWWLLISHISAS
jgi:hypothetical protein